MQLETEGIVMGAERTYQKRFARQAGQRLERSLGDPNEASLPSDFMELLKTADKRRKERGDAKEQASDRSLRPA